MIFDFETQLAKAPEEVKAKIIAANLASKRYQKAVTQVTLWSAERELAAAAHMAAQHDWTECLSRWNPETGEIQCREEKQA